MLAVVLALASMPSARAFAFAADRDQARLLHDALAGIARCRRCCGAWRSASYGVTAPGGASLQVMARTPQRPYLFATASGKPLGQDDAHNRR